MRAVQASDFALGEFRCLWRLLLVHGHWSYIRISEMILYFFYKNMAFTVPQFFFSFFAGFSGQTFFDEWYITFYNMIFTALPLVIRATFDQDVNYRLHANLSDDEYTRNLQQKFQNYLRNKFPEIYCIGQKSTIFTIPNYLFWASQGALHALIVFFFGYWCFDNESLSRAGYPGGMSSLTLTLFSSIILIVDLKLSLYTKYWTWLNVIAIFLLSLGLYFAYVIISHFLVGTYSEYTPLTMLKIPHFYLVCTFLVSFVLIMDALQAQITRHLFTTKVDQIRLAIKQFDERLNLHRIKQQPENLSARALTGQSQEGSFWEQVGKKEPEKQEKTIMTILKPPPGNHKFSLASLRE